MLDKGFSVGVSSPELEGLLDALSKDAADEFIEEVAEEAVRKIDYTPANTIKEAEQWVKTNTQVIHVDYKGLDVKTANAMNEALARQLELNPELAGKIKYYGTTQGQVNLAYKLDLEKPLRSLLTWDIHGKKQRSMHTG